MKCIKIPTRVLLPPKDDIFQVIDSYIPQLEEGDVLLITSKILAIHQGRCVKITGSISKDKLIIGEAERYIPRSRVPGKAALLTLKEHTLIPSAGIDESNGNGYYILWPKHTNRLLKIIATYLKKKCNITNLGVIATDSHTTPLRYGVLGISIGFFGLEPLYDYRGKPDIFGRELRHTKTNIVDALAAMGVLLMGEGDERVPMLIVRGATFVKFTNRNNYKQLVIPPEQDIYYPLLKVFRNKV